MYTLHTLISQNVFLLLTCLFAQHLNGREGLGAACPLPRPRIPFISVYSGLWLSSTVWYFLALRSYSREGQGEALPGSRWWATSASWWLSFAAKEDGRLRPTRMAQTPASLCLASYFHQLPQAGPISIFWGRKSELRELVRKGPWSSGNISFHLPSSSGTTVSPLTSGCLGDCNQGHPIHWSQRSLSSMLPERRRAVPGRTRMGRNLGVRVRPGSPIRTPALAFGSHQGFEARSSPHLYSRCSWF